MQKINVPLLGLSTNSEARGVKDGECSVLHNLTADAEGAKVIARPTEKIVTPVERSSEYFHEKAGRWLYIKAGSVYDEKGNRINSDGSVASLSFMGNIVVMYCADGVRYAIFDGNYRYLGTLPTLPELQIGIKPVHVTTLSDEKYYSDTADIADSNEGLRWMNASKGYFDECLSALYTQGAFIDRTLFRMAARLFDGSYVCYSPIYYVEDSDALIQNIGYAWLGTGHTIGRDNKNFFSRPRNTTGSSLSQYFTSVRGFLPTLHPAAYDLRRWRDIIVAIELFATPSIMGHESKSAELGKKNEYSLDTGSVAGGATVQLTTVNGYDRYVWKGAKKIREEVADASLFYKIAEFDLEGREVWRLENTSPTQLAVQTRLPLCEQPHVLAAASYKYIYNGKMHLAGVTELLCDAYANYSLAARTSESVIQITSVVTIGTEQGERRVVTTAKQPALHRGTDGYLLPPLLHYADARANNLRLCIAYKKGIDEFYGYRDFPLTAHKSLNLAYFLNDANTGSDHSIEVTNSSEALFVEVDEANSENAFVVAAREHFPSRDDCSGSYLFTYKGSGKWNLKVTFADNATEEKSGVTVFEYGLKLYSGGEPVIFVGDKIKEGETITVTLEQGLGTLAGLRPIEVGGDGWHTLTSDLADFTVDANDNVTGFALKNVGENREYTRKNVMRVSRVDNPLFFPAASTYSFDADIVAVCSNTVAVSQGQFGQHPLYVFTTEGVWLMSVDVSGAGSYLAQIPCSREICTNAAGVAVTTRGVLFPTAKGLMLINGSEVVNISEALAGLATPELLRTDDVAGRLCGIVGREALCSSVPFLDYLAGAFTAFDYKGDLLYVCNPAHDYVYVYNNSSGVWSTADGRYSAKVEHSDGLLLGYVADREDYRRYIFDNHNARVDAVPVVAITRGCLFGTSGFKRIDAAALRATFHAAKAGFYALGSVDGARWELVGGRDFSNESPVLRRDIVASFARSRACRYFAFAFVGEVRSDARVAIIEVAAQSDFEQKIR